MFFRCACHCSYGKCARIFTGENGNCEAVTAISQFCQGTVATSADALSSGWVREEPVGLTGRWKCTQALFSVELNQSKRNQHTRRIEVASCHVCARSALLVLSANNNFDTRLCGLCCMVQVKHSLMTDCCVTYVMHKPSFDISSSLPFRFHDVIHMPRSDT